MTPPVKTEKFYQSPSILIALALHAVLFLWLFQLSMDPEKKVRLDKTIGEHTVPSLIKETGIFGFITYYYDTHNEARLFYRYARLTLEGKLDYWLVKKYPDLKVKRPRPYRDISVEYQPGALLSILPPALLSNSFNEYRFWLGAWLGTLYLFNLAVGISLFTGTKPTAAQVNRMLWWSIAFLILFGSITVTRFDHVVPTCILLSALTFKFAMNQSGTKALFWFGIFGFVTALGVMTKIVPGIIMPAALMVLLYQEKPRWKESGFAVVSLAITLALINIMFYSAYGSKYLEWFTFHSRRGVQLESIYSGFILLANKLGLPAQVAFSYGSLNVDSIFTPAVKFLWPFLFLGVAGAIAWRVWKHRQVFVQSNLSPNAGVRQLLVITLVFLVAFTLANKVFSPQFMLWTGPLIAVWVGAEKRMFSISLVFLFATLLTQVIYPRLYHFLINLYFQMVLVLNVRNLVLAVFLIILIIKLPALLKENKSTA